MLLALGCGELIDGGPGANRLPEVFIVNIPADGSEFASSPVVHWYGTDSDGKVERYDYAVVVASEVDSVAAELPGEGSAVEKYIAAVLNRPEYPLWVSIFVDSMDAGELPTLDTIRLFASKFAADCDTEYVQVFDQETQTFDTLEFPVNCVSDTIPQYFFVRAIDDHDAASQIKYRSYKRRNHWPEARISVRFNQNGEYVSLKQLTSTYSGIEVIWGGEDRLDFVPPSVPFLEYYWRVYGPFPINPNDPNERPTLADTLTSDSIPLTPVLESANIDPLQGVWIRDTTALLHDLWRQIDSQEDPLNDTTVTRRAWFMFVVVTRDDAYISDESPAVATFKAIYPKFERKIALLDETAYESKAWANPALNPRQGTPTVNQNFWLDLLKSAYPEADTMEDFWWRNSTVPVFKKCNPPRVVCGNYVELEFLVRHKLCIIVDDDMWEPPSRPGQTPAVQDVIRKYLDAGGMVWLIGRNSLLPQPSICQSCKEKMFDLCDEESASYNLLSCTYFDVEACWYPGHRATALPPKREGDQAPRIPASNDEFVAATLVDPGSGLPPKLEIDRERVDSMFYPQYLYPIWALGGFTDKIVGVPEVNFLVLGSNSTPLYIFESWRPGGPIPPFNSQSFIQHKPVAVRRVGPDRITPTYKTCQMTFPLYFIKQDQAELLFQKTVEWFFLPFGQS